MLVLLGVLFTFTFFQPGRRLLIHRTFNEGGQQYSRTEVVKNQAVIDSYLRIVTRDKNYRLVLSKIPMDMVTRGALSPLYPFQEIS